MQNNFEAKKDTKKIFVVLCLIALANGLFYNFQELWMQNNNLSVKTIGTVMSLCSLLTVSMIFLFSNLVKNERLKKFSSILLLLKCILIFCLFVLNETGLNVLIKFIIMMEYVIDTELLTSIYPILAQINKNDRLYAKKGLIYSAFKMIGILITSFLLGKMLFSVTINYNSYLIVASILLLIAFIILSKLDITKYNIKKEEKKVNGKVLQKLVKKISKDKISKLYLLASISNQISFNSIVGLKMIILTQALDFSPSKGSTIWTILNVIAILIGALILAKLTFKNNYINLSIKLIGRLIFYIIAMIVNTKMLFFITFIFVKLLSESYEHVIDAPYVNRISKDYQFAFCNLKEMARYLGNAIGTFICGLAVVYGLRFNFLFAALFCLAEVILRFIALHFKNKEGEVEI